MNLALCRWAGWKEIPWEALTNPREAGEQKLFCRSDDERLCGWMPNFFDPVTGYYHCAMLEALLKAEEWLSYCSCLYKVINGTKDGHWTRDLMRAIPTHRATALYEVCPEEHKTPP